MWMAAVAAVGLASAFAANAQLSPIAPADVKWQAAGQGPGAAKIAVLEGDLLQPGPFTVRMRVPAGYVFEPHWHDGAEHVTVISGTVYVVFGDKIDRKKGKICLPGAYLAIPAGAHHGAWAQTAATLQIHGVGPLGMHPVR